MQFLLSFVVGGIDPIEIVVGLFVLLFFSFHFLFAHHPQASPYLRKIMFSTVVTSFSHLQVAIFRIFFLRVLSLYALLYGLYKRTSLTSEQTPLYDPLTRVDQEDCAGTVIGQEVVMCDHVSHALGKDLMSLYHLCYLWRETDIQTYEHSNIQRKGVVD